MNESGEKGGPAREAATGGASSASPHRARGRRARAATGRELGFASPRLDRGPVSLSAQKSGRTRGPGRCNVC